MDTYGVTYSNTWYKLTKENSFGGFLTYRFLWFLTYIFEVLETVIKNSLLTLHHRVARFPVSCQKDHNQPSLPYNTRALGWQLQMWNLVLTSSCGFGLGATVLGKRGDFIIQLKMAHLQFAFHLGEKYKFHCHLWGFKAAGGHFQSENKVLRKS